MKLTTAFLNLSASLLTLLFLYPGNSNSIKNDQSPVKQWPYYLPHHVKYWPEDPPHRRRDLEALNEHIKAGKKPIGVKKMGDDEGEIFFPEYWQFDGTPDSILPEIFDRDLDSSYTNASVFRLPLALHEIGDSGLRRRGKEELRALALLQGRGYQCPSGTTSCTSIDRPNSCCSTDETCYIITDTGMGDVGCCPNGSSCSSVQIGCSTGYTACPDNLGGGCCSPGFICNNVGCVASPSVTTIVVTNTITITSSQSSSTLLLTTTTTQLFTTTYGTSTTTTTGTGTYTGLQTTLACSSSYRACPVTLGGGCCLSDRQCGLTDCPTSSGASSTPRTSSTSTSTTDTSITTSKSSSTTSSSSQTITATTTGVAPVRPTSDTTAEVTTSESISTVTGDTCPTGGYYACSAYYPSLSGCCRIGRNCDTTSCPAATSSTVMVSNGVTIVGVGGTAAATATTSTGSCATGWQSCAASVGGGCCPQDYVCGTASCTASAAVSTVLGSTITASGTAVVGKESESKGKRRIGMVGWLGGVMGVCWIGGSIMAILLLW